MKQFKYYLLFTIILISFNAISQKGKSGWKLFPTSDTLRAAEGEAILTDSVLTPTDTFVPSPIIPGSVTTTANSAILEMNEWHIEKSKNNPKMKGYTVLLFSGSGANSKLKARNILLEFQDQYPEYITHLAWKSPNFEVRVGDYRSKLEAEKALRNIKQEFPTAFVKSDWIELPLLEEPIIKE